jgi:hypothetical protein
MKFTPKSEQELLSAGLYKEGIYDFEILTAEERKSKKGNDMIKLEVRVFNHDLGSAITVDDYLVDVPSMEFKIRHAAESVGLLDQYNTGFMGADDFVGKCGKLRLGIQEGALKEDGTRYRNKNSVEDYIAPSGGEVAKDKIEKELDDSIPFTWALPFILPALFIAHSGIIA